MAVDSNNLTPGLGPRVARLEEASQETIERVRALETEFAETRAKRGERDARIFDKLDRLEERIETLKEDQAKRSDRIEGDIKKFMLWLIGGLVMIIAYILERIFVGAF